MEPSTTQEQIRVEVVDESSGKLSLRGIRERLRVDARGHQSAPLVRQIVPWFLKPFVQRSKVNTMRTEDMPQGLRMTSPHDLYRGIVVFMEVQDQRGAPQQKHPQVKGWSTVRTDRVVRRHELSFRCAVRYSTLLL